RRGRGELARAGGGRAAVEEAGRARGWRACAAVPPCGGQRADERGKPQARGAGGRTPATAAAANRHPSGAGAARAAVAARGGRHAKRADPSAAAAGTRAPAAALPLGNIVRALARRKRRAGNRYAVAAARAIQPPRVPLRPSLWSDSWLR